MQNKGYTVYMRTFVAAALFLLYMGALAPTAFAAGFARQPMFLSHSDVVEGQTVSIYTVVVNTANGPFVGKLKVHEDSASIGTASVSLGAGEAQTVAVTWKPSAGTHTIVADLFDANSALVESSQGQFAVAAKIVVVSDTTHNSSSNASSTFSLLSSTTPAVEPSTPVVQAISNVSPGVASAVSPAFAVVDTARSATSNTLNSGINWAKTQIATSEKKGAVGQVLGAQTSKGTSTPAASGGIMNTAWIMFTTLILYLLTLLQYLVAHVAYFYPIIAIVFLYVLWKMMRKIRRPSYGR
jgi:hypothetical protein